VASDVRVDAALAMWADFPVSKTPRPLVLTDHDVIGPRTGFRDENQKNAYIDGNLVPPPHFPSAPSTADGYPIVSAPDAVEALRSAGDGRTLSNTSLVITDITLGAVTFALDRGPRLLPAWLISMREVAYPAAVLAVGPGARYMPPNIPHVRRIGGARVESDDARLTITFIGGPPDTHDYAAQTIESDTAVAVIIEPTRLPTGPTRAVGYRREVGVTLRSPLAARVLIDGTSGAPVVAVT
jgi:hypothetical protein